MKKYWMIAVAALCLAACSEKQNEPAPEPISFEEFGFTVADNPDVLFADNIIVSPAAGPLTIKFPSGTPAIALEALVPYFTVEEGAVVTVNGEEIKSGESTIDFSSDVDIYISKEKRNAMYSVSVSIKPLSKWILKATSTVAFDTDPYMAINPTDDVPYIAEVLKADATADEKPVLYRLSGAQFENLVSSGTITDTTASNISLNFDPDGVPYTMFVDKTMKSNRVSVFKVENGKASAIGEQASIYAINVPGCVFPISSSEVWALSQNNESNLADLARRGLNAAKFNGQAWSNAEAVTGRESDAYCYNPKGKTIGGKHYFFSHNQNKKTVSMYTYDKGAWVSIFENMKILKPDSTEELAEIYAIPMDFDVDSDGNIYFVCGCQFVSDAYNYALVKYDVETKTQSIIGGVITSITANSRDRISLGLDETNTPFLAYKLAATAAVTYITHISVETKTWSEPVAVNSVNGGAPTLAFASDGTGYLAVKNAETDLVEVYSNN
ncbi:MAG: hypothetical protein ACI395_03690 [Candidatus Cryptobacteroides sp.]